MCCIKRTNPPQRKESDMKKLLITLVGLIGIGCSDLALDPHGPFASMSITPGDTLITSGDTVRMQLTVYDESGNALPSPPAWVDADWRSTHKKDIQFLADGWIVGLKGSRMFVSVELGELRAGTPLRINPHTLHLKTGVYLNQAIQTLEHEVPLITGKNGLLRIFLSTGQVNFYDPPAIRVTLSSPSGMETYDLEPEVDAIEGTIYEGDLMRSYNVYVPGALVQQGLGVAVEVDPTGLLPIGAGSRIPSEGYAKIPVYDPPPFRQIIAPIKTRSGTFSIVDRVPAQMETMTLVLGMLYPFNDIELLEHEEIYFDVALEAGGAGWLAVLDGLAVIREMEVASGSVDPKWLYYGFLHPTYGAGVFGVAAGVPSSVAVGYTGVTYLHETGHNLNLFHAPCGFPENVDPDFPQKNGTIGAWGYNSVARELIPPDAYDLMSYCRQAVWLSVYHHNRMLDYRREKFMASVSATSETLLVWGSVDGEGQIKLRPSFVIDAEPITPSGIGSYRLEVYGPGDEPVYASYFSPTKRLDLDEGASFLFNLPYPGEISRITVTGPEDRADMGRGTEPTMAIVRNPVTGQVVGMYYNWIPAAADGLTQNSVTTSDGVPR